MWRKWRRHGLPVSSGVPLREQAAFGHGVSRAVIFKHEPVHGRGKSASNRTSIKWLSPSVEDKGMPGLCSFSQIWPYISLSGANAMPSNFLKLQGKCLRKAGENQAFCFSADLDLKAEKEKSPFPCRCRSILVPGSCAAAFPGAGEGAGGSCTAPVRSHTSELCVLRGSGIKDSQGLGSRSPRRSLQLLGCTPWLGKRTAAGGPQPTGSSRVTGRRGSSSLSCCPPSPPCSQAPTSPHGKGAATKEGRPSLKEQAGERLTLVGSHKILLKGLQKTWQALSHPGANRWECAALQRQTPERVVSLDADLTASPSLQPPVRQ